MNLHKLLGESREAVTDQDSPVGKGYPFRKESLFPVVQKGADDMSAVTLINGWILVHENLPAQLFLMTGNDLDMHR